MLCDEELNYCEKNPDTCKNGGECVSLESSDGYFKCICPPGISGKSCENLPEISTIDEIGNSTSEIEHASTEDLTVVSLENSTEEVPNNGENETEKK